jgi:TM2 domain-containing membrane protein YozV
MKPFNIFGLAIFFAGLASIAGFGLHKFFEDSSVPALVRWGMSAIMAGLIVVLISLIVERIKEKNK